MFLFRINFPFFLYSFLHFSVFKNNQFCVEKYSVWSLFKLPCQKKKCKCFSHFKCLKMTEFQSLESSEMLKLQTLQTNEIFKTDLCV